MQIPGPTLDLWDQKLWGWDRSSRIRPARERGRSSGAPAAATPLPTPTSRSTVFGAVLAPVHQACRAPSSLLASGGGRVDTRTRAFDSRITSSQLWGPDV